jgi:hypothetical protein
VDGDVNIGSSDTHTSKTLHPNVRTDSDLGGTIVDCAGFEDSRSPDKDFVASFLNKLILDSSIELKIVMVENYSTVMLNENRVAFLKVLKHLATILKHNHKYFEDSICLIATKNSDEKADEKVIKAIKLSLEKTLKHLEDTKKKTAGTQQTPHSQIEIDLVKFLLKNEKFAQFKKPSDKIDPRLATQCQNIRDLVLNKLTFATNIEGKFNVTLSSDSKIALSGNATEEAENKLYSLIDDEIIPSLIAVFDANSKVHRSQLIDFCESYLARLASNKFKSENDLKKFFDEQKLSNTTLSEFQFCFSKTEFLFHVTDQSFEKVRRNILLLNGGWIKISSHVKETCAKFTADEMAKLEHATLQMAGTLHKIIDERIRKIGDPIFANLIDDYSSKLTLISTHEQMLKFADDQGVGKTLIANIKNTLIHFHSTACKSELDEMHRKILQLNGARQEITITITTLKSEFITKIKSQVRENSGKVVDCVLATVKKQIESTNDRCQGIKYSEATLLSMNKVANFEDLATFASKHCSEFTTGKLLAEIKWQSEVLKRWGEEKESLDYLNQQICDMGKQVGSYKTFLTTLDEIEAQSENNDAICLRSELTTLLHSLDLNNFKSKISNLTKFGFSDSVVSSLSMLELSEANIQKLVYLLTSKLGVKGEISATISNDTSPMQQYFDRYVIVSEVLKGHVPSSIHIAFISASKKLIINSDLMLKNTHLILMAPVINITKDTVFQFDGDGGEQHPEKRAPKAVSPGENGIGGLDGNPGFSSGSLSIFALEIINPRNLTVRSRGGDGGDGQDGGDGKNGVVGEKTITKERAIPNSIDPSIAAVPILATAAALVALATPHKIVKKQRPVAYIKEPATDGGKGGNGGIGACPGQVGIVLKRKTAVCSTESYNGTSGKPGRGGKGGENPSLPESNIPASASNGADGIEPTADAVTANYKYKLDQAVVKSQINHFISLALKGCGSEGSDETKTFVDYLSTL